MVKLEFIETNGVDLTLFNHSQHYLTLLNPIQTEFDQLQYFVKCYALFRVKFTSLKSWWCKSNDIYTVWWVAKGVGRGCEWINLDSYLLVSRGPGGSFT